MTPFFRRVHTSVQPGLYRTRTFFISRTRTPNFGTRTGPVILGETGPGTRRDVPLNIFWSKIEKKWMLRDCYIPRLSKDMKIAKKSFRGQILYRTLDLLKKRRPCRICKKMFDSKYAFTVHVNKHKKRCVNCKCVYKTWKELENHEEFCSRRYGRTVILPRPPTRPVHQPKRPHKCALCKRRYEKYEHLFKHQVHRCTKRYVTSKWVVKI